MTSTPADFHPETTIRHKPPLSVYGWNQGTGGTFWYRIAEPLRGLAFRGHSVASGASLHDGTLQDFDIILTHMLHDPHGSEAWQKIARYGRQKLVLDVDDDVWNFDPRTDTHDYWTNERLRQLQDNIVAADLVTTPSESLADILRELNPNVVVLPNCVPDWLLRHEPMRPRKRFVMGYQGARQHTVDVQTIAQDVWHILNRHRNARIHIYGELNPIGWPNGRVIRTGWRSHVPDYYRGLSMTIGLGPLAPIPFNYQKSAIRAIEYAALGFPCILTDVPAYRPYITNGWNGWLVPPGTPWIDRLEWAYSNRDQLPVMGQCSRRAAAAWTTEANAHRWEDAYRG